MKPKVFLDTNIINSDSLLSLMGEKGAVARLASMADIMLAQTVLDELMEHKRRSFESGRRRLQRDQLIKKLGIDCTALSSATFEEIKEDLTKDSSIRYEAWQHDDPLALLSSIYDLAIKGKAPFETDSDKGFKDACIVLTVERYALTHEAETVYFVSNDSKAREYFSNKKQVRCFDSIDPLIKFLADSKPEAEPAASDTVVKVQAVKDFQEDPSQTIDELVNEFCKSRSFIATHEAIRRLNPYLHTMSQHDAESILKAAVENDQIRRIVTDDDVRGFVSAVLKRYPSCLPLDEYCSLVDDAGLINNRLDCRGNFILSRAERKAYEAFVERLVSKVQYRGYGSYAENDYSSIEPVLKEQLSLSAIDPNATSWSSVVEAFFKGDIYAPHTAVEIDVLSRFAAFMDAIGDAKRQSVLNAIKTRLEAIPFDAPF